MTMFSKWLINIEQVPLLPALLFFKTIPNEPGGFNRSKNKNLPGRIVLLEKYHSKIL